VEGIAIAGTGVILHQDGTPSAGDDALQTAGIVLERLAPVDTDHGVISGALRVTQTQTLPSGNRTIVTFTFGQARASVTTDAGPAVADGTGSVVPDDGGVGPPPGTNPEPAAGQPATADGPSSPTPDSPFSGVSSSVPALAQGPSTPSTQLSASPTSAGGAGPDEVSLRTTPRPALSAQAAAARRARATVRLSGLYVALMVAGLIGLACAGMTRARKDTSAWTS
jgi:hypothetical protein